MANKRATALITIFWTYIAFILAGGIFYGMVDDSPYVLLMSSHLELATAWDFVAVGSVIALGAVGVGGLPIGLALLRRAIIAWRRDLLLVLAVPVLALLLLGAFALIVLVVATHFFTIPLDGLQPTQVDRLAVITFMTLFALSALTGAAAVCLTVARADIGEPTFRLPGITITVQPFNFGLLPAGVATAAMALMLGGTAAWSLIAHTLSPRMVEQGKDSYLGYLGVTDSMVLAGVVTTMALCTLVSGLALLRGFRSPPLRALGA